MECSLTDSQFFDRLPSELLGPICAPLDSLSLVRLKRCGDRRVAQRVRLTEKVRHVRGDLDPVRTLKGSFKEVYSLCEFEGLLAASCDNDNIDLWNSEGTLVRSLGEEGKSWIYSLVEFDGKIAAGSHDGEIRLWTRDGACATTLSGHSGPVCCHCVFGELLVSGSDDETIVLYDCLAAREDDLVGLVEGREATAPFWPKKVPYDSYNACTLDTVNFDPILEVT